MYHREKTRRSTNKLAIKIKKSCFSSTCLLLCNNDISSQKRVQTVSRKDIDDLFYKEDQRVRSSKEKKMSDSKSATTHGTIRQALNKLFTKPLKMDKKPRDVYDLKKAIFEASPCIDLRQVRRGRKIFQIPRVIPSVKRQLFGVRRLLSVCGSTSGQNGHTSVKSSDSLSHKKEKTESVLPLGVKIDCTPFLINKNPPLSQKGADLLNGVKGRYTRTALLKTTKDQPFFGPLSSSLSKELRACSRSQSRSIESKKRTYKLASASRGSIRLAWWV